MTLTIHMVHATISEHTEHSDLTHKNVTDHSILFLNDLNFLESLATERLSN